MEIGGRTRMGRPSVEFCMINLESGSKDARKILAKDSKLDIEAYGCLNNCSECCKQLFALVNDEVVTGDTPEQLVENIYGNIAANVEEKRVLV